jgi:hypothetical protein
MTEGTFIKLYRKILDSKFYKEKRRFSKSEAWIDILLRAAWETGTLEIESYEKLAQRWNWSKSSVGRFIKILVNENMVEQRRDKLGTTLTVVNWRFYQGTRGKTGTKLTSKNESLPITEKEDKNILSLAEFVSMTKKEADKLVDEFGLEATKAMVEILNNYKGSSGKKYKSDYLAIRSWVIKRYQEDKKKGLLFNDGNLYDPPH